MSQEPSIKLLTSFFGGFYVFKGKLGVSGRMQADKRVEAAQKVRDHMNDLRKAQDNKKKAAAKKRLTTKKKK